MTTTNKPVGLTKDTGYEFGIRKTIAITNNQAWKFLTSLEGIHLWLGEVSDFHLNKGYSYQTADGITGEVRIVNPEVNIRLTWQPADWSKSSTVQIRIIPAGEKTTISFHQENLPNAESRERMRQHWTGVIKAIEKQLAG